MSTLSSMKIWILSVALVGFLSCKKTEVVQHEPYLDITTQDNSFYYPVGHSSYHFIIDYKASPNSRVYWSSPDSFEVNLFAETITEPVINYSTYTREDSTGNQIVYINPTLIGKTIRVYARYNNIIDSLKIKFY